MRIPPVIGISGRARCGKDTIANFILAQYGGYTYSFADPIRAMLKAIGIDMADPYWQEHKEDVIAVIGKSPRQMMQTLGTEWGRELVHSDFWLILARQALANNGPGMVIADVRFDNEAQWVRDQGGTIIHVERTAAGPVAEHKSEGGVIKALSDITIYNNTSLEELQHCVAHIFREPLGA